jgi:glycosyltransferase involved in cell wall biosynthesis
MTLPGKVSIVIPCYNHGAMLPEALASIARVGNDNLLEVIIVNDGSTDPQTLDLFAGLDRSKYTVIHQPNSGLGAARNAGIRAAHGEFILPLDSDNRIRSPYLTEGVVRLDQDSKLGVVYGHAQYFGEKNGTVLTPAFDIALLSVMNFIDACALFRKAAWESVRGYDENMPHMGWEDWDFWLRLAIHGWEFARLDETAFDYRVSAGSMINDTNKHAAELLEYILGKPEHRLLRLLREKQIALQATATELAALKSSMDYQLGRQLLKPARSLKNIATGRK